MSTLKQLFEKAREKLLPDVKAKVEPPEGLFASGSSQRIAKWLLANHPDEASAMSALNWYINRAGKGLSDNRKAALEIAKGLIQKDKKK